MGRVRNPQKVNLQMCLGGNKTCHDSTKSGFSTLWGGNETHWIPKKGKLSLALCFNGSGACLDSAKSESPNLFGWKWGKSGFQKHWIGLPTVGVEMGQVRVSEQANFRIKLVGYGVSPDSRKLNWESRKSDFFSKSVWGGMWHVRISENIQFRICLGEHGACPDHTKKKIVNSDWGGNGRVRIPETENFQIWFDGNWGFRKESIS